MVFDTGATISTFNNLKWFTELLTLPRPLPFTTSDSKLAHVYYKGTVELTFPLFVGTTVSYKVKGVYFNSSSPVNLIGTDDMKEAGMLWDMEHNHLYGHGKRFQLQSYNGLPIHPTIPNPTTSVTPEQMALASITFSLMHKRLLHANKDIVI